MSSSYRGSHPLSRARAALRAQHRLSLASQSGNLDENADLERGEAEQDASENQNGLDAPLLDSVDNRSQDVGSTLASLITSAPQEARHSLRHEARTSNISNRENPLARFQSAVRHVKQQQQVVNQFPRKQSMAEGFYRGFMQLGSGIALMSTTQPDIDANAEPPGLISPKTDAKALYGLLVGSYMNVLLIAAPLGFAANIFHWGPVAVFLLNFLALLPLALVLGEVTEDLAVRFGDTIGGLLNATFGNVVELILSIAALTKGLFTVVAMSLIGSILSNLLLVLGCCFLCGGARFKQQSFSLMINKACCSLLFLTCIALCIPTAANKLYGPDVVTKESQLRLSHSTAILLILVYCFYLLFQLKTHSQVLSEDQDNGCDHEGDDGGDDEDADDPVERAHAQDKPVLSLVAAFGLLAVITVVVAVASELLTGALEAVSEESGLSARFLGLIVLPIAGNACEHITAVFVAIKDKMDLAIGVALGSSIQIASFVLPAVVIVGWIIGQPFTLDFDPFISLLLTLSVIHAYFVTSDGQSNWLLGLQLLGTYTLIGLLYLFLPDPE